MNNLDNQKIKSFSGYENSSNIVDTNPPKFKNVKIVDHYPLEIAIVTICLTSNHEECSGQYVDTIGKFLIKCLCKCHISAKNKSEKNLTHNYSISSKTGVIPVD